MCRIAPTPSVSLNDKTIGCGGTWSGRNASVPGWNTSVTGWSASATGCAADDRGRRVHRVGEQLWLAQDDIIRRDHLARARPEREDEAVVWLRPRLCGVGFLCDRAKRQRQREACRAGAERQYQREARRAAQDRATTNGPRAGRSGMHDYARTGSAGTSWSSQ